MPPIQTKPVIGLTGGIGAGKSFVARVMQESGCFIIEADKLAADALESPLVREAVIDLCGPQVRRSDGSLDRSAVARHVFGNQEALRRLEQIVHPPIQARRAELRRQAQADPSIRAIVEDSPLLLEKGLDAACNVVIFVNAPREVRLERIKQRGWTAQDLDLREKRQLPLDFKAVKADYVINNDSDAATCRIQVRQILSRILPPQH